MSREMEEYGIPGEEHVSDAEIWEIQKKYAGNPRQANAALRSMGYDGPQLKRPSAYEAMQKMARETDGTDGLDVEGPEL